MPRLQLGLPQLELGPSALSMAEGVGVWYDQDAILDADFANSRFRFDGTSYTDETAFLAAIGGSKSGITRTIGPYVDPAASELITNGDFATGDLTGWTSVLNGTSTAAIIAGAVRLTGDGTTGTGAGGAGVSQGFTAVVDKAYRALYDSVTGSTGFRIGGTTSTGVGPAGGTKSPATGYSETFSADATTSYFYAFRTSGTGGLDNVSIKECLPFKNFVQAGLTVEVAGVTPAAASGTKVLWSSGNTGASAADDEIQIIYNASGELHVQTNRGASAQADINLGAVAVNTAFTVLAGFANNNFYAALNGGAAIADTSGTKPGLGAMRVGRNFAGNTWDGTINRVKVYATGGKEQFYGLVANAIHFEGDSFAGGAQSVVLPTTLQTDMARSIYNTGVGAATMSDIAGRMVAASAAAKAKTTVVWDGSQGVEFTTVANYCDTLQTGLTALGHSRYIVIPVCTDRGQADVTTEVAIRDEFVTRWGSHVLDWRNVLTMNGAVPADTMFAKTDGSDNTHLSQAAMDLMSTAIKSLIVANGW